jgi:hypothetical protein
MSHPPHNNRFQSRKYNEKNGENNENIQTDRAHIYEGEFRLKETSGTVGMMEDHYSNNKTTKCSP